MKILIKPETNEVIAASKVAEIASNGIQLDNYTYGIAVSSEGEFVEEMPTILDVLEIPNDFAPYTYLYIDGAFIPNSQYSRYESDSDKITRLESENGQLKVDIAKVNSDLAQQNQTLSDFMDYIFSIMPVA